MRGIKIKNGTKLKCVDSFKHTEHIGFEVGKVYIVSCGYIADGDGDKFQAQYDPNGNGNLIKTRSRFKEV